MRKRIMNPFQKYSCLLLLLVHLILPIRFSTDLRAQDEVPRNGQTVSVNGIEMYYERRGQGEPLILLHGFFGSGRAWDAYVKELSEHFELIVPDLRGHGRSTNPTESFTHRQSAKDVFALLDHLNITKFRVAGISTGGMTALHMATSQPDRVSTMILIGATHYFPEQAREIMRATTEEGLTAEELERRRRVHQHGDEQIHKLVRQFNGFKDSYDDMNFTRPFLSTITARTLIIHGDRDQFFPVEIPLEMYQSIPDAALWIIPKGGHVPIGGNHVPFVPVVLAFLREIE
jgi:pimeloyl-ACP methyl ester carboxylesterase